MPTQPLTHRTLEQLRDCIRQAARDLCDLAYQEEFSDNLALAAVSLSTTLRFITLELNPEYKHVPYTSTPRLPDQRELDLTPEPADSIPGQSPDHP